MDDLAIRVTGLGKQYRLGAQQERYLTLRDQVRKWAAAPLRTLLRRAKRAERRPPFWALKDVAFEVRRGEVVGVVGRNGAGKSTLLKVLSRITEPTEGEVDVHGRVGSLLEVGTGFHPELTGRENVYLNGAILGMRRAEIVRKFDEIVSFAEVEKFIDTPVKHYSSGMYMRLAFAVAAHLEPEILVVDEVLAVGDAAFQKKCLGKMGDVAKVGRTVLLVSHQMQAIQAITRRAILLDRGRLVSEGPTPVIVKQYLGASRAEQDLTDVGQQGDNSARFRRVSISTPRAEAAESVVQGEVMQITFELETTQPVRDGNLGIAVRNGDGVEVFSSSWGETHNALLQLEPGPHRFRVGVPTQYLRPGPYWLTLCLTRDLSAVVVLVPGVELPAVVKETADLAMTIEIYKWGVVDIRCEWDRA